MGTFRIKINENPDTDIDNAIAGEDLISGDLCYLNTDGRYWKTNANDINKCSTELRIAKDTILANAEGPFLAQGSISTTGLTVGVRYYVANLSGQITTIELDYPNIVRYIGTASFTNQLEFNPMDINYNKRIQEQISNIQSDLNYEHIQSLPSTTWIINHNLNKKPNVTIIDTANNAVIGNINYIDNNNITVTFASSFSGIATLN